jgi:hypothetical protein
MLYRIRDTQCGFLCDLPHYKKTPSDGFSESSGPDLVASLVNAAATAVEMATPSLPGRGTVFKPGNVTNGDR